MADTLSRQTARELVQSGLTQRQFARMAGISRGTLASRLRLAKQQAGQPSTAGGAIEDHPLSFTETDDGAVVASDSDTIRTLDELLAACKIDLKLWEVERYEVKTYQGYRRNETKNLQFDRGRITGEVFDAGRITLVTMYAIKAWLKRRLERPFEETVDRLIERLRSQPKPKPVVRQYPVGDYLFVPAIYDAHFGRRSVDGTYTIEQARQDFEAAGHALIARACSMGMPINRILLPVGNDILNADTLLETTTRGTWQQMSGDLRDVVHAVCQSYIALIEQYIQVAPVDVVVVESNHDRYGCYWLGEFLAGYFVHHPDEQYVTIDSRRGPTKYYEFGKNLIGMEHGDRAKARDLALRMAQEAPEMWGRTTYRVFLRGHFHKEYEMVTPVASPMGVTVITFPAFCPPDEWEILKGYVGNHRQAEGRFYHHDHGPAGMFPVFVNEIA